MVEYPRKYNFKPNYTYINAGLLPETLHFQPDDLLYKCSLSEDDFAFNLFLGMQHLIHYFELLSFNKSYLLHRIILTHIDYLHSLARSAGAELEKRFVSSEYFFMTKYVLSIFIQSQDNVVRQLTIDQMERICLFLTDKSLLMQSCSNLRPELIHYGFKPRNCVVFSSFLIPNTVMVKKKFKFIDQKFFQKTEMECHCRTKIWLDSNSCWYEKDYMLLEVVFDVYHGNFLGFLDFLQYFIRGMDFKNYFIKSLRTVLMTNELNYVILSDVPYNELRLVEKNLKPGQAFAPFLGEIATSKLIFTIYRNNMFSKNHAILSKYLRSVYRKKWVSQYEDINYWNDLDLLQTESIEILILTFLDSFNIWKAICIDYTDFLTRIKTLGRDKAMQTMNQSQHSELNNKSKENGRRKSFQMSLTTNIPDLNIEIPQCTSADDETEDNHKNSNKEVENFFTVIYARTYDYNKGIKSCLNHFLRSVLRCNTELNKDEQNLLNLKARDDKVILKDGVAGYFNLNHTKPMTDQLLSGGDTAKKTARLSFCARDILKSTKEQQDIDETLEIHDEMQQDSLSSDECLVTLNFNDYTIDANRKLSKEFTNDELNSEQPLMLLQSSSTSNQDVHFIKDGWFGDEEHNATFLKMVDLYMEESLKCTFSDSCMKKLQKVFGDKPNTAFDIFEESTLLHSQFWQQLLEIPSSQSSLLLPVLKEQICDIEDYYKPNVNRKMLDIIYTNTIVNIFITIHVITNKELQRFSYFQSLLEGKELNLKYFHSICEITKNRYVGSLLPPSKDSYIAVSQAISNLIFDFYLLCHSQVRAVTAMFHRHKIEFLNMFKIMPEEFKLIFNLVEFAMKLELTEMNLDTERPEDYKRIYMKHHIMLKKIYYLFFNSNCCVLKGNRGIRIVYHSMRFENAKTRQLFLRKHGDRRVRKVENNCHCLISMKIIKNKNTRNEENLVEIYYDMMSGNHWKCIDMLRVLLEDNGSSQTHSHRTLVCLPTGELWVFITSEWIKHHFTPLLQQIQQHASSKPNEILELDDIRNNIEIQKIFSDDAF